MPVPPITNTAQQPPMQNSTLTRKQQQTRGSGFTNLNQILDANKGAGQRMGQQIGGQLTNQADSVRAGIQSSQNQFNTQKNQAGQQATGAVQAGQNLVRQAGESDEAYDARLAQGNQNYSQIGQNLRNAEYNGPMGLQNAGKLQAQGATASALGRLAGNTQGQSELLRSMVARPGGYTSGQSALDSILLGNGGQQAIQQGRRAAIGLDQQAMNASNQAEAQANALKSGIATNKAQALSDLQNAATGDNGIIAQGANAATQFNQDAQDLSKILSGTYDLSSSKNKQRAQDLVNRMGDFGLQDYNIYNKDQNAVNSALSQLASTVQSGGNQYFKGNIGLAGQNLADVLGDSDLKNQIANNKFNTNVFGSEDTAFNNLNNQRTYDTETKNILTGAASTLHGIKQNIVNQVQSDLQNRLATINAGPDKVNTLDMFGNPIQKTKQQLIDEATAQSNARVNSIMNQIHGGDVFGINGIIGGDLVGYSANHSLGDQFSGKDAEGNPYGFLAFGDHGEADLGKRFQGLGLTADAGASSGMYRNEQAFINAANKALGPDAQMKNLILQRIMGNAGQPLDLNSGSPNTLTMKS